MMEIYNDIVILYILVQSMSHVSEKYICVYMSVSKKELKARAKANIQTSLGL